MNVASASLTLLVPYKERLLFNLSVNTGVLTAYRVNDLEYAAYILGSNIEEVKSIAERRGLNERIESKIQEVSTIPSYDSLTNYEFLIKLPEILHTACFLGFVALQAKTMTVEEVLGDEGIIHELTHINACSIKVNDETISKIRAQFKELQRMAIGFF